MEILSGGMGSESKLLKMIKPTKDPKQAKTGGKDSKTATGGGTQGPAAGGAAEADKGQAAEAMPIEAPPEVGTGFFSKVPHNKTLMLDRFVPTADKHNHGLVGMEFSFVDV